MSEKRRYIYLFSEGGKDMKQILGGKGANLSEMTKIGLPVPPGFTLSTEACNEYFNNEGELPNERKEGIYEALGIIEERTDKKFGDANNPLLVSVRSGAVISMPGMMDTVLNLGLNDETVEGLSRLTGNPRFALDSYRRFIQMFGDVVLGISHGIFEDEISKVKGRYQVSEDPDLDETALKELIEKFKGIVKKEKGLVFPQDPWEQLVLAIKAVFDSWNNRRARVYRDVHNISHDLGTAVNVQAMVFGNMGNDSGTGVAFTRNPSTGEKEVYGEFLLNAQGEDVVAGTRTPKAIQDLKRDFPEVYQQFIEVSQLLERHYQDMQDIEFTVENRKLYLLQTRNGKRTAAAAVKIAVDMANEGLIDKEKAINRVTPDQVAHLLHPQVDPDQQIDLLAEGLPASPGAATGKIVFEADAAEKMKAEGEQVILTRPETTPDDIHGIIAAEGILTSRGGMTSHAAVVARGMGKPCICGCDVLRIDPQNKTMLIQGVTYKEGDLISIDGGTGKVISGRVKLTDPGLSYESEQLLSWADELKQLGVRANADTPEDARKAREFGGKGIGLCRTEHMFMGAERLQKMQEMIVAESETERQETLEKLLPYQENDFYEILKAMDGYPTTIRLLDPPLHEFLPDAGKLEQEVERLKHGGDRNNNIEEYRHKQELLNKVKVLEESNPMLGFRGCRVGLIYPEIYSMQVKAIIKATKKLLKENYSPQPEIMIPLVGHAKELEIMREMINEIMDTYLKEDEKEVFHIGTMIELPRACVTADEIAQHADFFSFGTNDLTQTTLGYSRDDAEGKFLAHYLQDKVISKNPFMVLDQTGVGPLVQMAVEKSRKTNPQLVEGICGEHGGDPESIHFFHKVELNYVSCSPFRVPVARLAAAQAAIKK